jgi:hypothetical protein
LREGNDLRVLGCEFGYFIAASRVAVDCVNATVVADDFGESDTDVTAARADVHAGPAFAQAEAVERGGQRPAVHVITQPEFDNARLGGDEPHD